MASFLAVRALPPLLALSFVAALPLIRYDRRAQPGLLLLGGLVVFAALSMTWSTAPSPVGNLERFTALKLLLQLVGYSGLALAALQLSKNCASRCLKVLAACLIGLALLLIIESFSGAAAYQWLSRQTGEVTQRARAMRNVSHGAYLLAVLVWPAGMILRWHQRSVLIGGAILAVTLTGVLLDADAPVFALVASVIAFSLVMLLGRAGVVIIGVLASILWLAAPWIILTISGWRGLLSLRDHIPPSWAERISIYEYVSNRISHRPWLGWGLDANRGLNGIALHPHSAPLHYWLDLGVVGAALATAFLSWLFWRIARSAEDRTLAAAAAASLVSFLTISLVSFSAWEEWWLSIGAVGLLSSIALGRARQA